MAEDKFREKLKRGRFNENIIKVNKSGNKMTYQHLSGPSIPGKTQKILKNSPHAQRINSFLQSSMRYGRHKREKSYQKDLDNTFSKEDILKLAQRGRPSSILRSKKKGFTTSSHRFDKK